MESATEKTTLTSMVGNREHYACSSNIMSSMPSSIVTNRHVPRKRLKDIALLLISKKDPSDSDKNLMQEFAVDFKLIL